MIFCRHSYKLVKMFRFVTPNSDYPYAVVVLCQCERCGKIKKVKIKP